MMIAGMTLGYFVPAPGIYLILAFDIVFAGAFAPLTLGLFWKKSNMPAAITSLLLGSALRLFFFFAFDQGLIGAEWAGLDTLIPPPISFAVFIGVAYATQKKYPGKARHDVRDYVPPEEDLIAGEDLKHFKEVGDAGGNISNRSAL
jgi:Na+(H+)/acetate symporter ActP